MSDFWPTSEEDLNRNPLDEFRGLPNPADQFRKLPIPLGGQGKQRFNSSD